MAEKKAEPSEAKGDSVEPRAPSQGSLSFNGQLLIATLNLGAYAKGCGVSRKTGRPIFQNKTIWQKI